MFQMPHSNLNWNQSRCCFLHPQVDRHPLSSPLPASPASSSMRRPKSAMRHQASSLSLTAWAFLCTFLCCVLLLLLVYIYTLTVIQTVSCPPSRIAENFGAKGGPLIHLVHVPKAAGTSLRRMVFEWVSSYNSIMARSTLSKDRRIAVQDHNFQARCERGAQIPDSGLIIGHIGFGLGDGAPANRMNVLVHSGGRSTIHPWMIGLRNTPKLVHSRLISFTLIKRQYLIRLFTKVCMTNLVTLLDMNA